MNRHQRRSKPGSSILPYANLVAENAQLRQALADANEQLAEWRELLLDNDLVEATPREHLWDILSLHSWTPMKMSDRWIGGCEHSWSDLVCHGLTDQQIDELVKRDEGDGLDIGEHPSTITAETDPRCEDCRGEVPLLAVSGGSE